MAGGGTATRDKYVTPIAANLYIGGKGNATLENVWQGTAYDGRTIGGGLLMIYADNITIGDMAKFESYGKTINGSCWAYKYNGIYMSGGAGGGSGGGSINIFYKNAILGLDSSKFTVVAGSYSPKGTYNVGSILTGTYQSTLITE